LAEGLNRVALMDEAVAIAGLAEFGDVPFVDALDVFVESLESEAKLDDARRASASSTIVELLVKRLRLVADRKRHPDISKEVVRAPLFIVGAPRTGSTHLHSLMGQVEGVRVPLFWEMTFPSPPPERETATSDPRIQQIQARTDQIPDELLMRHPMAPMRPEQCNMLLDWSFINFAPVASYEIPTYRNWFLNTDHAPAYEAHYRTLQHLQWRHPGQWVLKYPKHLFGFDALLDRYPDARFVWTHRDPATVLPSVASFTGLMRSPTPGFDSQKFGREWAMLEELGLRRGIELRDRRTDLTDRHLDIHYRDLMANPVATVKGICDRFGIGFEDASADRIQRWIDEHPKTQFGEHRYTPEQFGFDTEGLRRRFAFYIDRFGIALDGES
jgi:Sulfotransferase family